MNFEIIIPLQPGEDLISHGSMQFSSSKCCRQRNKARLLSKNKENSVKVNSTEDVRQTVRTILSGESTIEELPICIHVEEFDILNEEFMLNIMNVVRFPRPLLLIGTKLQCIMYPFQSGLWRQKD